MLVHVPPEASNTVPVKVTNGEFAQVVVPTPASTDGPVEYTISIVSLAEGHPLKPKAVSTRLTEPAVVSAILEM